jgi:hypothetical protein
MWDCLVSDISLHVQLWNGKKHNEDIDGAEVIGASTLEYGLPVMVNHKLRWWRYSHKCDISSMKVHFHHHKLKYRWTAMPVFPLPWVTPQYTLIIILGVCHLIWEEGHYTWNWWPTLEESRNWGWDVLEGHQNKNGVSAHEGCLPQGQVAGLSIEDQQFSVLLCSWIHRSE